MISTPPGFDDRAFELEVAELWYSPSQGEELAADPTSSAGVFENTYGRRVVATSVGFCLRKDGRRVGTARSYIRTASSQEALDGVCAERRLEAELDGFRFEVGAMLGAQAKSLPRITSRSARAALRRMVALEDAVAFYRTTSDVLRFPQAKSSARTEHPPE